MIFSLNFSLTVAMSKSRLPIAYLMAGKLQNGLYVLGPPQFLPCSSLSLIANSKSANSSIKNLCCNVNENLVSSDFLFHQDHQVILLCGITDLGILPPIL